MKTVRPEMSGDQYKQYLEETFHEYFEHGDTYEVIVCYYPRWSLTAMLLFV